jgi:hypothetical protein
MMMMRRFPAYLTGPLLCLIGEDLILLLQMVRVVRLACVEGGVLRVQSSVCYYISK